MIPTTVRKTAKVKTERYCSLPGECKAQSTWDTCHARSRSLGGASHVFRGVYLRGLTSGMSWRRSSFSTWSVGSLQSSPPTFLVRSQIHKTPKFSFPLTDQESSNRYSGAWFSPRNMQNRPQRAANNLNCITVSTRRHIPRQILPKSCRIRDEKGGTGDVYTMKNGLGNAISE